MSNVGFATLQVIPSAKGFKSALSKDIDAPIAAAGKDSGEKFGKGMGGSAVASLKSFAGPLAAALGTAAVFSYLKDATSAASDLNETLSKTGQIFGADMLPELKSFAEGAAASMGQTQQQALDAAATFGIFGKSAGLTGTDLTGFSKELTTLASDMASFGNADIDETINAIGSGLRGEAEPLRRFGVLLSADAINARALSMGLAKTNVDMVGVAAAQMKVKEASQASQAAIKKYGADSDEAKKAGIGLALAQKGIAKAVGGTAPKLTAQQKLLAVQAEIMAQTGDQQGDFGRTSQGLANQQRILAAQFENVKIKIGNVFLPMLTKVFQALNRYLIPAIEWVGTAISSAFKSKAMQDFIVRARAVFTTLVEKVGEFIAKFRKAGESKAMASLTSAGELLRTVFTKISEFVTTTLLPSLKEIGGIIATNVVPIFNTLAAYFTGTLLPAFASFAGFITDQILPRILDLYGVIYRSLIPIIRAVAETVSQRIVPALVAMGTAILGAVDKAKPFITFLVRIIAGVVGFAAKILGFLIPIILKLAGPIFSFLIKIIVKVIGWVGKILGWVGQFGNKLLDSGAMVTDFAKTVGTKIGDVVQFFKDLPGKIGSAIGGLGKLLYQKGKDVVNGLLDGAGSILPSIGRFFLDKLPGWMQGPFKKALGINSPSKVFAGYGKNVGQGFVKGLESQGSSIRSAVQGMGADASIAPTLAVAPLGVPNVGGAGSGGAGRGFAPTIVNNYPAPEKASESLTVSLRRAAFAMGV